VHTTVNIPPAPQPPSPILAGGLCLKQAAATSVSILTGPPITVMDKGQREAMRNLMHDSQYRDWILMMMMMMCTLETKLNAYVVV
jgi:hypothetical protein